MSLRRSLHTVLKPKSRKGFRGYPVATVAFYGAEATGASKVAVGIAPDANGNVAVLKRWFSTDMDARTDRAVGDSVLDFIKTEGVKSVVMSEGIIGCPHEEGADYPEGEKCPQCSYWANRDRWTGKLIQ